jgi:hypothetical protein
LVANSIFDYIFDTESWSVYGVERERLESIISTLEEREKQSLLWIIAEIKSLS